jgi:hypothetical protein
MNSTNRPQRRYLRRNACLRVFKQGDTDLLVSELKLDHVEDLTESSLDSASTHSEPGSARMKWAAASCNTNSLDDSLAKKDKSGVKFGTVHVRSHQNVLGNNPSCSTGLPVELDWDHCHSENFLVDVYEEMRSGVPKRVIRIHPRDRERVLRLKGHSHGSFQNVLLEIDLIKQSREASAHECDTTEDYIMMLGGNDQVINEQMKRDEKHPDVNTSDMEEYLLMASSRRERKNRGDRTTGTRIQSKSPMRKVFHWK